MKHRLVLVAAAALSLAACGGGVGGGPTSNPIVNPTPPVPTATPAPGPTGAAASLTLSFHVGPGPATAGKRPAWVSPSTTQIVVTVNTVNGGTPPATFPNPATTNLVVGTNCTVTGGVETCVIPVAAPAGTVNYTFTVGDGTHDLATWSGDQTITSGTNNALDIALMGIAHHVTVTGPAFDSQATLGTYPQALTVAAYDFDGNLISGTYAHAISLSDGDAAGATSLTVNGVGAGPTASVTASGDLVTLNYNGQVVNAFAVSPSGTGITCLDSTSCTLTPDPPNDIVFAGTANDTTPNGGLNTDPNWGQQTVFFAQISGTRAVTASEVGYTGGGFNKVFGSTVNCGSGGSTIATVAGDVTSATGTTFTVTPLKAGVCSVQLAEIGSGYPIVNPGHPASVSGTPTKNGLFWISVTTGSVGIDHSKH